MDTKSDRAGGLTTGTNTQYNGASQHQISPPPISLPKGGGAIRGMGEKFAANPVSGTGSMSVPIMTSPGRSGFGPRLSLSYDSGAGNGPFGLGWSLSLPSITRKTDKGLPGYADADESDVFILSGAEDLVPVLVQANGAWEREIVPDRVVDGKTYRIQRYRPRVEGLFARIERWSNQNDAAESFWRSISRDNVTTWYGRTAQSRIADPSHPEHIFSWLICETHDDKGNLIVYEYREENSENVDPAQAHERNRTAETRSSNRYLKRIKYGNRTPYFPVLSANQAVTPHPAEWLFEAVLDYGDHETEAPAPNGTRSWPVRLDPFSSYRAAFEVRTYRLCQRVLMFHHFPQELGFADYLVRSTDFTYSYEQSPGDARNSIFSFLLSATQSGYTRRPDGSYLKKSLPALEFEYSQPVISAETHEVDPASLANLPYGLNNDHYHWVDLDGEGISGVLSEQAGAWFYKRNLSPLVPEIAATEAQPVTRFGAIERVSEKPSLAVLSGGGQQLLDLAGDGQLNVVNLTGPTPGFYERSAADRWGSFIPFASLPVLGWDNPNVRFVDLTGDGHADILITEDEAFSWYPSLAEAGFGAAERIAKALDEEHGPRLLFADGTDSVYLADFSGDGLTDLVRIRNGEVCYWPNLGYGRFGAKVTTDNAPWFDAPDQFEQRRIRLADIDGSGLTDIIYLGADGVRLYFNESGNGWSTAVGLNAFPPVDRFASVQAADLLGNGTACLVWSSPLPGAENILRYIDLMGGQKPHLLVKSANNLGAETDVHYAPSTKFYLADKLAGRPWISRIPFPVHVVERVETYDRISRNRFVTRYAYHHGYYDGAEREFRGFGMVEQWDTEEFATLNQSGELSPAENIDESSHVPPVLTKSWFHTGIYVARDHVSNFHAGMLDANDAGEYYRETKIVDGEPTALSDEEARALLLEDTVLPEGLTIEEEREACRALKGAMLRQEVYGLDGSEKAAHPYTVTEQNFTVRMLQPQAANRRPVFFTHTREALTYQYERNPQDPRVSHALTLEVDDYGDVLKSAAIAYGRRTPDVNLTAADQALQAQTLITFAENEFTNAIDLEEAYRVPLPYQTRTYEITGLSVPPGQSRFTLTQLLETGASAEPRSYEEQPGAGVQKRLIEHTRTLYRPDDLGLSREETLALLPLGRVESLGLAGESYRLALPAGLVAQVFGGKVDGTVLHTDGGYVHTEGDADWWIPSGRSFLSPNTDDGPAAELVYAREHFFQAARFRDPFHRTGFETESFAAYDVHDLLLVQTRDALNNTIVAVSDYRVLQPTRITDPNGNRTEAAFDALGMLVGTAVMGKENEKKGDSLVGFNPDLDEATVVAHIADPLSNPHAILQSATTRLIYDLFAYERTRNHLEPQPAVGYALARETHAADLVNGEQTRVQHRFSYSDGFGREVQRKIQAEAGPLSPGGTDINPRWVGTGWAIFNNKGNPVRQFEPFFSATHAFEFNVRAGVSPILFYDPAARLIATLNPDHTWQKAVFDSWFQEKWDVNDTVLIGEPAGDPDMGAFFSRLAEAEYQPTWYQERIGGLLGSEQQEAARKSAVHAETPAVTHLDSLGRTFSSVAHNKFKRKMTNGSTVSVEEKYKSQVVLDIQGNQRDIIDHKNRVVMHYDYGMNANRIHSISMDAGERWILNDVNGLPIRAWDARGHEFRTQYDQLRRPVRQYARGSDPVHSDPRMFNRDLLFAKVDYGEGQMADVQRNLRTRAYKSYDTAGVITSDQYDYKGNLLRGERQLTADYKSIPDWAGAVDLDSEVFERTSSYDALNRTITIIMPDSTEMKPRYNEANLLDRMQARIRGASEWTTFIEDVDYNAKGQREMIVYGNGVTTRYEYDPVRFHLMSLKTTRSTAGDLQSLSYTYDPAGNITHVKDAARQTIFFDNTRITPDADYTYDAIYQLIEAAGREHIGQTAQVDHKDPPIRPVPHPNDLEAMRRYIECYEYDPVGNILAVIHHAGGGNWIRRYRYATDSNRLLSTSVPGDLSDERYTDEYEYDPHGSMTRMAHLRWLAWDFAERMHSSSRQDTSESTRETTYYVYDATGQRVRKVTVLQNGARRQERIYLGGLEIYREYGGSDSSGGSGRAVTLERETLQVVDDKQRIALVETKTADAESPLSSAISLIRYQFANHLGSATMELNDAGQVISYEEYHPYGTTSYHAADSAIGAGAKRYRYSAKEKDEETGFFYHGARYYACWLGRWTAADPSDVADGLNVYCFNHDTPIRFVDPNGRGAIDQMKNIAYGVGGAAGNKVQSVYQGAATLASNVYNDPAGTALIMAKESLPGKLLTGNFSGAWNDVWEEGAYTVNNVGNLLKSGVGLYQAEYLHTLRTGTQQEIQAATEKTIDDTAGMIDTASDIISFGTKTAAKIVLKKSLIGGAAATGAAVGSVVHGSKKTGGIPDVDISDEITEEIPIKDPQAVLKALLEQDDRLLQRSDYGHPPFSSDVAPEITLSGHATWDRPNEWVIVPERTWVRTFADIGNTITDQQGRFIERGLPLTPKAIFGPGDRFPNFRLTPPEGLSLRGDPVYVNPDYPEGVYVSEILKPGLCTVNWAACLSRSSGK